MAVRDSKRRRYFLTVFAIALAAIGLVVLGSFWKSALEQRYLTQARRALANNDYPQAYRLSAKLLEYRPDSLEARRTAAKSARVLGHSKQAIGHLRWIESAGASTAGDYLLMGEVSLDRGRPSDAEEYFNRALTFEPGFHAARLQLIHLLSVECRIYEALAHRHELLRRKAWTTEQLMYMAKPADLMDSPDLEFFLRRDPDNPHLLLAKARHLRLVHDYGEAAKLVERALEARPDLVEAHADRGLLLLEGPPSQQAFAQWQADLPADADQHPDVWVVRGMWAKLRADHEAAARCFGEALNLDPVHHRAMYQLSIVLASLGEDALASELSSRAGLLDELARAVDDVYDVPNSVQNWTRAAELLESLGRLHEAAAWYQSVVGVDRDDLTASAKARELRARLTPDSPIVLAESNPVLDLSLENYPLPLFTPDLSSPRPDLSRGANVIRFSDVAKLRGIDFNFLGADEPVHRTRRIFEIFGAGIAVVDFDLDGWPDIYFAQAAPSPKGNGQAAHLDQLFWNRGGESFQRVTTAAYTGDDRFSQGTSAGDFNSDGFPDLFVANVGENRLYQNNGDGTFSDVTSEAGIGGKKWTVSCAIADLNGDSLPDIYEVNYLGGEQIFEVLCNGYHTTGLSCRPRDFPPEPDRFYLNLGDGRFSDSTTQAGMVAPDGRGLGIVVADFEGDGALSIFVANDTTANHFYVTRSRRGQMPYFEDRAGLAGLAFDRNGLSQACMGIAVGDADADGLLDLFVTNFYDEPNTLYRGLDEQYFEDATSAATLHLPSLPLLGFGTQFLDADLDGDLDLVVANGHIADDEPNDVAFQMRPQFFENRNGRFVELRGVDVGEYFMRRLLGRALARLDFDRDGREDFAVTHLDAPVAMLRNETPDAGHFLSIQLRGRESNRDAIGATVTVVSTSGESRVGQVTAGDGYQSSNQRQLIFGLEDASTATKLVVRWPSGTVEEFSDVAAAREMILVEGHARLVEIVR